MSHRALGRIGRFLMCMRIAHQTSLREERYLSRRVVRHIEQRMSADHLTSSLHRYISHIGKIMPYSIGFLTLLRELLRSLRCILTGYRGGRQTPAIDP